MRSLGLFAVLGAVVGCASSITPDAGARDARVLDGGTPIDSGVVVCNGHDASSFPSFDRACTMDSDCIIGAHQTDCCGSIAAMGMASSEGARFAASESACEAMYPGCGCDSGTVVADDGSNAPPGTGTSAVVVHCTAGVCTTTVRSSVPCGATTCTPTQTCVMECTGIPVDAGTLPSHCVDVPPACATSSSCDCFGGANPCPTGECISVEHGVPLCRCA